MERVKRALSLYINYYLFRRTPTLVYSAERSGSVTLLHSLRSHGVFTIGAHYLDPKKLLHPQKFLDPEKRVEQHHSGTAKWASKHLLSKQKQVKVITMVRSPIENMLSTFAREQYGQQTPESIQKESISSAKELSQEFCQAYLESDHYLQPLEWFETEFQPALGVDVYQHPFDQRCRFARFREKSYEVLILGTELEDEQKSALVADFVGVPKLQISNRTVAAQTSASSKKNCLPPGKPGQQTAYAEKYKILKQHVVIPENYLDAIVDSQYTRHFFSEQEREAIRLKYGSRGTHK